MYEIELFQEWADLKCSVMEGSASFVDMSKWEKSLRELRKKSNLSYDELSRVNKALKIIQLKKEKV